jgi:cyanophycinase
MPSKISEGGTRGWIVPIGGAENKENDRHILERFIRVSGGSDADIVVIPTASRMNETGPRYETLFRELGAAQVAVMDFDTRRDCQEAGRLRRIEQATGIFFTGGNQLRLTTLLGGTPVAKLIRVRNAQGVTVGGTSAGASILSEHMIAFGDEGSSVISGSVRLAPGLGLTNRFIIDQHFRQRDRLGRLITALAYNPFAVGQLFFDRRGRRRSTGVRARTSFAHTDGRRDVQSAYAARCRGWAQTGKGIASGCESSIDRCMSGRRCTRAFRLSAWNWT